MDGLRMKFVLHYLYLYDMVKQGETIW